MKVVNPRWIARCKHRFLDGRGRQCLLPVGHLGDHSLEPVMPVLGPDWLLASEQPQGDRE